MNKTKDLLAQFTKYTLQQIPRDQNSNADALAKLASAKDADTLNIVPVERLRKPSIQAVETSMEIRMKDTWMAPYLECLTNGVLPTDRNKARNLQRQAARYILVDGVMYRRGYSMPLLRCVTPEKAKELMKEVHEGFCGDHAGGQSLAKKILRQGYFWPTMNEDSMELVRRCDKCQRFSKIPRAAPNELKQMQSP